MDSRPGARGSYQALTSSSEICRSAHHRRSGSELVEQHAVLRPGGRPKRATAVLRFSSHRSAYSRSFGALRLRTPCSTVSGATPSSRSRHVARTATRSRRPWLRRSSERGRAGRPVRCSRPDSGPTEASRCDRTRAVFGTSYRLRARPVRHFISPVPCPLPIGGLRRSREDGTAARRSRRRWAPRPRTPSLLVAEAAELGQEPPALATSGCRQRRLAGNVAHPRGPSRTRPRPRRCHREHERVDSADRPSLSRLRVLINVRIPLVGKKPGSAVDSHHAEMWRDSPGRPIQSPRPTVSERSRHHDASALT